MSVDKENQFDQVIQVLVLPGTRMNMILPQANVVELVHYNDIKLISKDGLVGKFNWRNYLVPLVSFEQMVGHEEFKPRLSHQKSGRSVMVKSVLNDQSIEYYALEIQAIPHTIKLRKGDIMELPKGDSKCQHQSYVAHYTQLTGLKAYIPNLEAMEMRLAQLM